MALGHGVEADDIAVEVRRQRDIAVVADRKLLFHDLAAGLLRTPGLFSAIIADEIDDGAACSAGSPLHLRERTACPAGASVHRKGPHVIEAVARLRNLAQLHAEDRLIERLRALHVTDIDL